MSAFRVYLIPGLLLVLAGIAMFIVYGEAGLSSSEALVSALLIVPGLQIINIGIMTRVFSIKVNLLPSNPAWDRLIQYAGFDTGLIVSISLVVVASGIILISWNDFNPARTVLSFILLTLAVQVMSTSFTVSILKIHKRFD